MTEKTAYLTARNLVKKFGDFTAVDDISLSVGPGEVLGFLGPNGAGKTTTMKMLTGFLEPTSGEVWIKGMSITKGEVEPRRRIGYLPEGAPLYGEMTVAAFLNFVADVHSFKAREKRKRITDAAQAVDLLPVFNQRIDTLSKGYKRRLGLAAAIFHGPDVLILDEPTDGLDPNQKHEVRNLIRAMSKNRAIIISTHILEEVGALCSRAIIINQGQIVADGTPADLMARSRYCGALVMMVDKKQIDMIARVLSSHQAIIDLETAWEGGKVRLTLIPDNAYLTKESLRITDIVGDLAVENDWKISQFALDGGRLDDVFRDVTTRQVKKDQNNCPDTKVADIPTEKGAG